MKASGLYDPKEFLDKIREMFSVERVYGEPIEANGKTVIPVVSIGCGGGGGGGSGEGPASPPGTGTEKDDSTGENAAVGTGGGMGFGFGGGATPLGFLVVEDEKTKWIPILNIERIVLKVLEIAATVIKLRGQLLKKTAGKR